MSINHKHFIIDERESIFKYLALGFKKTKIARLVLIEELKEILLMENIGLRNLKLCT